MVGVGRGSAPLKPRKGAAAPQLQATRDAPPLRDRRVEAPPALPNQELQTSSFMQKNILFKNTFHKCMAYVQSTKDSPFPSPPASSGFNPGRPPACQLPLAAGQGVSGRSQRGWSPARSDRSRLCNCAEASSRSHRPAERGRDGLSPRSRRPCERLRCCGLSLQGFSGIGGDLPCQS